MIIKTIKFANAQKAAIKAAGAGLASTTYGRSRLFIDRKKQQNKHACRGKFTF